MPVDYQALLSTAEDLDKEQQQLNTKVEEDRISKQRWLISFETQELLRDVEKNFEVTLTSLINNYDTQEEFWVRGKVAELRVLKHYISRITNKGEQ